MRWRRQQQRGDSLGSARSGPPPPALPSASQARWLRWRCDAMLPPRGAGDSLHRSAGGCESGVSECVLRTGYWLAADWLQSSRGAGSPPAPRKKQPEHRCVHTTHLQHFISLWEHQDESQAARCHGFTVAHRPSHPCSRMFFKQSLPVVGLTLCSRWSTAPRDRCRESSSSSAEPAEMFMCETPAVYVVCLQHTTCILMPM